MNTQVIVIILIVAAAAVVFWLVSRAKKKKKEAGMISNFPIAFLRDPQPFLFNGYTAGGVWVLATVANVPVRFLDLIDEGINNQLSRMNAAYPHWHNHKLLSDYIVWLIPPETHNRETEPGSPALYVRNTQTAGTCLGVANDGLQMAPTIVAPHQEGEGWRFEDYFMRTIWHESEHVREWVNDRNEFWRYANAFDQHPHVP